MRVVDYQTEISETETELRTLEKRQSNAKLLLRTQLLRLLKSGEFLQLKKAVEILGITEKYGYDLWKKYKTEGLDSYLQLNYKANRAKLNQEQKAKLVERARVLIRNQRHKNILKINSESVTHNKEFRCFFRG